MDNSKNNSECFNEDGTLLESLDFYKNKKKDVIFWVNNSHICIGEHLFTFDKKKIYNLFADYPHNLTEEEKRIFDKENPYWRDFFAGRSE